MHGASFPRAGTVAIIVMLIQLPVAASVALQWFYTCIFQSKRDRHCLRSPNELFHWFI